MVACLNMKSSDPGLIHLMNQRILFKLVNDNYTILIVFVVLSVFLLLIFLYFFKNVMNTIKLYNKHAKRLELAPAPTDNQYDKDADNEKYKSKDIDPDVDAFNLRAIEDPADYMPRTKKEFIKEMDTKYQEYNTLKSDYIITNHKKTSDDVVDSQVLFKKYDDYKYNPKKVDEL